MPAEVWLVRLDAPVDDVLVQRFRAWLAPEEREKHLRFATGALRDEFLVTRALGRWALSRRLPHVRPAEWSFERTADDRPHVVSPVPAPDFNLANTAGAVVCAVSEHRIGIDVENEDAATLLLEHDREMFTKDERAELVALDDRRRRRRAVELWTSKEAYLKALGTGISTRPNEVCITGERWEIELVRFGPFVVAVALDPATRPLVVREVAVSEIR